MLIFELFIYSFHTYRQIIIYVCCSLHFWLKFQLGNFLLSRLARLLFPVPQKRKPSTPPPPELYSPRLEISNCLVAVWLAICLDLGPLAVALFRLAHCLETSHGQKT